MFRPMRRAKQQLSDAEANRILDAGTSGVLALMGDDGYPYAVPLSYMHCGGAIYFHCANAGHKLDAVRYCDRASFCLIAQDDVTPEDYSTRYRSAIAFGRIAVVEDEKEQREAIQAICRRYYPEGTEQRHDREIDGHAGAFTILKLTIEQLTGKESKALAQERK